MKLNLGCGTDYINNWINIDKGNVYCDIQHDIELFPWPINDNCVTEIKMQHILEHINKDNFIDFMREIYRVCQSNCIINIISPYAGSDNFWTDPTHKMPLTLRTFDYFDENKALGINGKIYGWSDIKLKVLEASKIPNEPNGPDVYFKLLIIK
jgi:hypothetical protein